MFIAKLISLLPFCALYIISDICYIIVRYIIRYRYKVVKTNISKAFPTKSKDEIRYTINGFYKHLCDSAFETIATLSMSEKEMKEHFIYTNPEILESFAASGKNTIVLFGHYANWEWVASGPLWLKNLNISTLYKPLKNKSFDNLYKDIRERFGTICIDKNKVLRGMVQMSKLNKPYALAFIADQSPSINNIHHWETFLNQDSAMLTGWETIARKSNSPVIYLDIQKTKRGYYTCTIKLIEENPQNTELYTLTHKYATLMEETIKQNPALWLWSHKRWKHKRTILRDK